MEARGKGTVTSLSSLFPAEEAQKAAQRVKDNITEKYKELDNLHSFVNDNTSLINLVNRLPDELHHQIMVPFGKAAFFPGRLVHTNEFMVLLGEGYFAERSAKQTADILKRRGNMLDSEVDSLKSVIEDLKTEASFFDKTAEEAAEGLVEIREEYIDDDDDDGGEEGFEESMSNSVQGQENSNAPNVSVADSATGVIDDQEYARMMARFDELEKEELELEDIEHQDEDKYDEDLDTQDKEHSDGRSYGNVFSDVSHPEVAATSNQKNSSWLPIRKDESSFTKALPQTLVGKSVVENVPTVLKTSVQPVSKSKPKVGASMSNQDAGSLMSRQAINSLKAFSGSIVERTVDVPTNSKKETTSQEPSKPISRFKMQRKGGQI
ncbi:uncharacterized protein LOC141601445 isoform X2 [Silene latifolia]|uniref:uncharacterized protein LOC141601445 isoform X2 n=1 Tax=Silene latifolia TaxID=37657 RepID=UPI003D783088